MSLNLALTAAVSSLMSVQKQMGVASNNIANATTEGYSKQTVNLASRVTGGVGTGVTDNGITTSVDKFLLASIVASTTSSSAASTLSSYFQTLQKSLGTISTSETGGSDLSSLLSSLQSDLTLLANNPEQSSLETSVVTDLDNIFSTLRSTSTAIQNQRTQADKEIATTVDDINTQVAKIRSMNLAIASAQARGEDTASFEDTRNAALQALSADLPVNYYLDANNQMQIYTDGGQALLVGNFARTVEHTPASLSSTITYGGGGIDGITIAGVDITTQLSASDGKLGALVAMRDTELPAVQSELDTLASTLATTLNSIYNSGTPNPATSPVTGSNTAAIAGTDAVTSTATVRIAMVDSAGKIQSYQDVDLSAATDVNGVVAAINTAFGATVASLNANGQLVLTSNVAGTGVSVATASGAINGTDFSSFFHLNDLVSGTSAINISVKPSILTQSTLFSSGSLSTAAGTVPFTGLTSGDSSVATKLADALLGNQSFGASGHLASASTSFASYAASLISDTATRASSAEDSESTATTKLSALKSTMSARAGVNTDEETASLVTLQNLYSSSAKIVSTVQSMFQALLSAVQG